MDAPAPLNYQTTGKAIPQESVNCMEKNGEYSWNNACHGKNVSANVDRGSIVGNMPCMLGS